MGGSVYRISTRQEYEKINCQSKNKKLLARMEGN